MKIKLCGIFRDVDIDYVNDLAPDYIGFVFAKSRREISPFRASRLRSRLLSCVTPVGVFVNAPAEEVAALYRDGVIAMAQLHGSEDAAYIAALKTLSRGISPIPVIKAVKAESREGILREAAVFSGADYLLLDHLSGGTGTPFNWSVMGDGAFLDSLSLPCFLAGGITCENVEKAIYYRPCALDVSSGAETGGVKDPQKMRSLIAAVRNSGK